MNKVLIPVIIAVVLYVAASFGHANFDISTWNGEARAFLSFLWVLSSVVSIATYIGIGN